MLADRCALQRCAIGFRNQTPARRMPHVNSIGISFALPHASPDCLFPQPNSGRQIRPYRPVDQTWSTFQMPPITGRPVLLSLPRCLNKNHRGVRCCRYYTASNNHVVIQPDQSCGGHIGKSHQCFSSHDGFGWPQLCGKGITNGFGLFTQNQNGYRASENREAEDLFYWSRGHWSWMSRDIMANPPGVCTLSYNFTWLKFSLFYPSLFVQFSRLGW